MSVLPSLRLPVFPSVNVFAVSARQLERLISRPVSMLLTIATGLVHSLVESQRHLDVHVSFDTAGFTGSVPKGEGMASALLCPHLLVMHVLLLGTATAYGLCRCDET